MCYNTRTKYDECGNELLAKNDTEEPVGNSTY